MQYETDTILDNGHGFTGIDPGITPLITTSDGMQIVPLNTFRKIEKKLKGEQIKLSKKEERVK